MSFFGAKNLDSGDELFSAAIYRLKEKIAQNALRIVRENGYLQYNTSVAFGGIREIVNFDGKLEEKYENRTL